MSQNTLIEKIKQDAANTIADIKSTEKTMVEDIKRETKAEIAVLNESHTLAVNKRLAQLELVSVSRANQAGNIALQRAKREQIDSLFVEVSSELEGMSSEEYVAFFQKYATEIIPQTVQVTTVQVPVARQAEAKKILEGLGLEGEVVVTSSIKAGLIVFTNDGVYDVTLARMLSEKRAELEMEMVNKVMA